MPVPNFLEPLPDCNCGVKRPNSSLAPHAKTCPKYPLLNSTIIDRLVSYAIQGNYALVDDNPKRFRRHWLKWGSLLLIACGANFYVVRQLVITQDLYATLCWIGVNATLGLACAHAALQPLRIKTAYDQGASDMQLKVAKQAGIYVSMEDGK